MPIYEYQCKGCHEVFEVLVMGSRGRDASCPGCGSREIERLLSTFSFSGHGIRSRSGQGASCSSCSASSCHGCKG